MNKIVKWLFLFLVIFSAPAFADINTEKAEDFVKKVTAQGIEELINTDVPEAEKKARFTKLFNEDLDLDFIGKFVLGRYWKMSGKEQQKRFIDVYRKLNIQTWSARFGEFKGKKFEFIGVEKSKSKDQAFVNTQVPMKEGNPAIVRWRVKETNGQMKIVDIIIENVSLAQTARSEYTAYINKSPDGVEGLIKNLQSKIK